MVKYEDRDKLMQHDGPNGWDSRDPAYREVCGGELERHQGLEAPTIGKEGYQCKAILADGSHVSGHFGKEAKRRRRR